MKWNFFAMTMKTKHTKSLSRKLKRSSRIHHKEYIIQYEKYLHESYPFTRFASPFRWNLWYKVLVRYRVNKSYE